MPSLSVIIPTLNEAANVAAAVASARDAGAAEVIVVDAASADGTASLARSAGATVVEGVRGRGPQMNAGAAAASGDVLLFLHADCRLPADAADRIDAALADPAVVAGGFRQRIGAAGRRFRWLEAGNALRVRRWGRVYGDQGMFVRADAFRGAGGFPPQPLMEDYELSGRLARRGRVVLLEGPLTVDARRWLTRGVVRQTATNWAFVLLYRLGVSPVRLAAWYRHVR